MEKEVSQFECFLLNKYMSSEFSGGLHLGRKARSTSNTKLIRKLTWHCAEEIRHASVWQDLISELQLPIKNVHDSEGDEYFSHMNEIKSTIDLLVFTHIFEIRVPFHFAMHAKWTKNEKIKNVLEKLIPEEEPHLRWIKEYLQKEIEEGNDSVYDAIKKFKQIEKETYYNDLEKLEKQGEEGKSFVTLIREHLKEFEETKQWWEE